MKANGRPGEFYFKAIFRQKQEMFGQTVNGWKLTDAFYKSRKEVEEALDPNNFNIDWPVEEIGESTLYVPSEDELKEEQE